MSWGLLGEKRSCCCWWWSSAGVSVLGCAFAGALSDAAGVGCVTSRYSVFTHHLGCFYPSPPRATSLAVASEVHLVLVSPVTTAGPGSACTPQDWLSDRVFCALRGSKCQHSIVLCVLVSEQPSVNLTANVSWVTVSFLCYFVFFRADVARIQPWLMFPDTLWCCPGLLGFKC